MTSENTPETTPRNHPPRLLVAIGTRPEEIKLRPLVRALLEKDAHVDMFWSGQHRGLHTLPERTWGDDLVEGVSRCIKDFSARLRSPAEAYDAVIVQGDTATAYAAAVAAFLEDVPVAHVEAGLRTYAKEPHPEEAFRRMIAAVATWHFCPDEDAAENITHECYGYAHRGRGLQLPSPCFQGVHIVGNTVIDTLPPEDLRVLVTLHRRENWGERIQNALTTIQNFASEHPLDFSATIIRHPNWAAQGITTAFTQPIDPIPSVEHSKIIDWFRRHVFDLVVTDSGGLQEEAAHFGIPVLVLRTSTERTALVDAGAVQLVHPDDPAALRAALDAALRKRRCYGDGTASQKIASILLKSLDTNP